MKECIKNLKVQVKTLKYCLIIKKKIENKKVKKRKDIREDNNDIERRKDC